MDGASGAPQSAAGSFSAVRRHCDCSEWMCVGEFKGIVGVRGEDESVQVVELCGCEVVKLEDAAGRPSRGVYICRRSSPDVNAFQCRSCQTASEGAST